MELRARIGVEIDPSAAVSGAETAVRAADKMRDGMNRAATGAEKAFESMRKSTERLEKQLAEVDKAAEAAGEGIEDAGDDAKNAERKMSGLEGVLNGVGSSLKSAANGVAIFSPRLANLIGLGGRVKGALGDMKSSIAGVDKSSKEAAGGVGSMTAKIGTIGAVVGVAIGAIGAIIAVLGALKLATMAASFAFNFLGESIEAGASGAQTQVAFDVLIGDAERAGKAIADLKKLAGETPLEVREVVNAGQQLIAFGTAAEDVVDVVRRLGDVSSAFDSLSLKELSDIYGKIQTQGRVQQEDINQLAGRGIPIYSALAETMGVAESEIRKLVETGRVGFPQIEGAFKNMTNEGGQFFEMMKRQSTTFNGLLSTLKDAWAELQGIIGGPISDELRPLLADAIEAMEMIKAKALEFLPEIREATSFFVAGLQTAFGSADGFTDAILAGKEALLIVANEVVKTAGILFGKMMEKVTFDFGTALREIFADKTITENLATGMHNIAATFGNSIVSNLEQAARIAAGIGSFGLSEGARALAGGTKEGAQQAGFFALKGFVDGSDRNASAPAAIDFTAEAKAAADRITEALKGNSQVQAYASKVAEQQNENLVNFANKGIPALLARPREDGVPELLARPSTENFFAEQFKQFEQGRVLVPALPEGGDSNDVQKKQLAELERIGDRFNRADPFARRDQDNADAQRAAEAGTISADVLQRTLAANEERFRKATAPKDPEVKKALAADGSGRTAEAAQSSLESRAKSLISSVKTPAEDLAEMTKELDNLKSAGLITGEEFTRLTAKAQADYGEALESMAEKQRRMADEGKTQLEKLGEAWGNLAVQVDNANVAAAQSIASNLTTALTDIASGTVSAGEAFEKMATAIVGDITRIVIQLLVQYAISQALGFNLGPIGGAASVSVKHDGSGSATSRRRSVNPEMFASAKRYHSGGRVGGGGQVPGLAPNEEPAILENGETVLTRRDSNRLRTQLSGEDSPKSGGNMTQLTVLNVDDPERIKEIIANDPSVILNAMNRRLPMFKKLLNS